MLYKSHKIVGLATAAAVAVTYNHPVTFGGFVMVLIGSGLPDIDNQSSKLGRMVPIISKHLKHRGITHSIYVIILCILGMIGTSNLLLNALSLGVLTHILTDLFSYDGLDLFLTGDTIRMPITYTTGGKSENRLRLLAWCVLLYYSYILLIPIFTMFN